MSARNPARAAPCGILNVAKPPSITSHDVVDAIRRATGLRRVGHAGTLDPAATGVLLVCLGSATRVSDYLMASTKAYRATIRFGEVSTTDDAEGELTVSGSVDSLDKLSIQQALLQFVGEIDQVPPSYAAIKIAGQPLYRRARAGQPVLAPPRRVQIERIELVAWQQPEIVVDVTCSKGTYLRALARDLGRDLGCGAYLRSLASGVAEGKIELEELGDASIDLSDEEVAARLLALPGIGPYGTAHMMMLLGRHSRLVLDSWTRPKYARVRGRKATDSQIERRFRRYGGYSGLAFWLYLTRDWVADDDPTPGASPRR